MQPIAHAGHEVRNEGEGWRVMIWPWEVVYAIVDFRVWIACAFSAEFEYCPISTMFVVKELHELICGVPIRFLGPY